MISALDFAVRAGNGAGSLPSGDVAEFLCVLMLIIALLAMSAARIFDPSDWW